MNESRSALPVIEMIGGHSLCSSIIPKDPVVVDLGANHGEFTLAVRKRFNAAVYAVEASPVVFARLQDLPCAGKFNLAISGSCGTTTLNISPNTEANSCFKLTGSEYTESVTVETITLEELLKRNRISAADVLKIDIEGSELEMFHSTSDETLAGFGQVTVEFHEWLGCGSVKEVRDIISRMNRIGFFHFSLVRGNYGDVLFVNRNLISPWQYRMALLKIWLPRTLKYLGKKIKLSPN